MVWIQSFSSRIKCPDKRFEHCSSFPPFTPAPQSACCISERKVLPASCTWNKRRYKTHTLVDYGRESDITKAVTIAEDMVSISTVEQLLKHQLPSQRYFESCCQKCLLKLPRSSLPGSTKCLTSHWWHVVHVSHTWKTGLKPACLQTTAGSTQLKPCRMLSQPGLNEANVVEAVQLNNRLQLDTAECNTESADLN